MTRTLRPAVSLLLCLALAAGCQARALAPVTPCTRAYFDTRMTLENFSEVDVLFVVEDSASMAREHALLEAALPGFVEALFSGDHDGDGWADTTPVRSLHVGFVRDDLGGGLAVAAGESIEACEMGFGGDGVLLTCGGSAPIHSYSVDPGGGIAGPPPPGCSLFTAAGCALQQPLESALIALAAASPVADYVAFDYVPPVFSGGRPGHGDGLNRGLIRRNSVLVIVTVGDEDDCSVPDYALFGDAPPFAGAPLGLRCHDFPDAVYPVERYADGFLALRAIPGFLVLASLSGVPSELAGSGAAAFERMLADPRMIETVDPSEVPGTRLLGSCATADGGEALPPRRVVELAAALDARGASTAVHSICAADFEPALRDVARLAGEALGGRCLPRPLVVAADGTLECEVLELLAPAGSGAPVTRCADVVGAEPRGVEVDDRGVAREICVVHQLALAERGTGASGWFYDTSERVVSRCAGSYPPGQDITFEAHRPSLGSEVRFTCRQRVLPGAGIGGYCVTGAELAGRATWENPCPGFELPSGADLDGDGGRDHLSCDALTRSCVVRCRDDDDCTRAGLPGEVCDLRPTREVTGGPVPAGVDPLAPHAVCVSPTCAG